MSANPAAARDHVTFETAAQHASTQVPVVAPSCNAADARQQLVGQRFESASHIIVCDGQRFRGVVRIEDLLAAYAGTTMEALMDPAAPVVAPGVDQEVAAWRAVRKRESGLTVVDSEGRFVGVIPPHGLLAVLLSEHEEDLSRLGGFTKGEAKARTTSEEPVERRLEHRIPWLLVGLGGALLAAGIVGRYEQQLQHQVMLAFFVPSIVYLADAVGTQTETIIVRGLSVGVGIRRMARREILSGLAIGLVLAAVAAPLVYLLWRQADVALAVGLSVFAASSVATGVALVLPWALDTLGVDPAFGSGPMATVVQDILSILIYFGIATAIVR